MKVYIDSEFKCHTTNDGTFLEVEDTFFDGKCVEFIEGIRFVPFGESWTREDGEVFTGKMITPWKDSVKLDNAQREYEKQLLAEYAEALQIVEVMP